MTEEILSLNEKLQTSQQECDTLNDNLASERAQIEDKEREIQEARDTIAEQLKAI